jgi:TolB-like protein
MKRRKNSFRKLVALFFVIPLVDCAGADVFFEPDMDFASVQSVAVLPFGNLTGQKEAAERVRDTFMGRLLATGAVYVLPPGEVARGLMKMERIPRDGPSTEQIKQLSVILEVDAIITGVVREYGPVRSGATSANVISVSLQMIEVSAGQVVWSASSTKGGIGIWDRLFGGGGQPMNTVTVKAVDELLDELFD